MKKIIFFLIAVAMLFTACKPSTPKNTYVPSEQPSSVEANPTEEPADKPTAVTSTPIPDGVVVPVDSEDNYSPILYCSGGEFLFLGGSLNGQWLGLDRFETKLDGEVVDSLSQEPGTKKSLEFALMKKDQYIDFYNNDGSMGVVHVRVLHLLLTVMETIYTKLILM